MTGHDTLLQHHFVLIHGFGNTTKEMERFKLWLQDAGISCSQIQLPFHASQEDFVEFEIESFLSSFRLQLLEEFRDHSSEETVVVSTSLSSLAIAYLQAELPRFKHVALAPYLGANSWRSSLLRIFGALYPSLWFKRKRDADTGVRHVDFSLSSKLNVAATLQVDELAADVRKRINGFGEDALIIHSFSDRVAAFGHSTAFFECNRAGCDFITLLGAPHSFSNSLNPEALYDLMNEHFCGPEDSLESELAVAATQFTELNIEHRSWANKIFSLIVGFVTAFSVLTYQTLGDVLDGAASAPYFLMAYATIIYLYVLVASLYYYYLNRTQNYLSAYVEPVMGGVGFQQFKLSRNLSGSESVSLTFNTSFALVVMPFLIASVAIVYTVVAYYDRVISFDIANAFLQFWLGTNLALYVLSQISAVRLAKSTKKTIYAPPIPFKRTMRKTERIVRLVLSSNYRGR